MKKSIYYFGVLLCYYTVVHPATGLLKFKCDEAPSGPYSIASAEIVATAAEESDSDSLSFELESDELTYAQRFNEIVDKLATQGVSMATMTDEAKASWEELHTIGSSFVDNAVMYGRIIIRECSLPDDKKTIKPLKIGGLAGGDKYISQGIFFKFTKDKEMGEGLWIYGGLKADDYLASKSASQELLSFNYLASSTNKVRIPLMAVIDYRGRRLLAMASLPLDEWILIYGSPDAGETVMAANPEVIGIMEEIGKKFNLRPHAVQDQNMALCGDIEVHRTDGAETNTYYCLDTARIFPPEPPSGKLQNISYEKMRPEFVVRYRKPLSSDGFSNFQTQKDEAKQYNHDLREAAAYLYNEHIPAYVKLITQKDLIDQILAGTSLYYAARWSHRDTFDNFLINHMHNYGLNIRHLGKIAQALQNILSDSVTDRMFHRLSNYISTLMMSRVLKNYARKIAREEVKDEKELYVRMVDLMNKIVGKKAIFFDMVRNLVFEKFGFRLKDAYGDCNQGFLLLDFTQLMGIVMYPKSFADFMGNYAPHMDFVFAIGDILEITPIIKYLNIIDLATGIYYLQLPAESERTSKDYMLKAKTRLEKALARWADISHPLIPDGFMGKFEAIKKAILASKALRNSGSEKMLVQNTVDPLAALPEAFFEGSRKMEDENLVGEEIEEGNRKYRGYGSQRQFRLSGDEDIDPSRPQLSHTVEQWDGDQQ
jgi:hypothetical protein